MKKYEEISGNRRGCASEEISEKMKKKIIEK